MRLITGRNACYLLAGVYLLANVVTALGQTREASLRLTVSDPSGAAIPDAQVFIHRRGEEARTIRTGALGEAVLSRLEPGSYRLQVMASGFAPYENDSVALRSGPNQLAVKMELATVQDELLVSEDKREASTDPRGNAFTNVLTQDQIALLPDDPEMFEEAIRNMAGPGATLRVNGFRGGKIPPKDQIREIRFRMNPYAAENHDAGFISIDILTKPGIDSWHGSFNGGFRDESMNARNPLSPVRGPEQTRRFTFDLGGPLWRNRTSLFVSADGANDYDTKTIVAATPDGRFNDIVVRPARRLNLTARAEHALTQSQTLRTEFQRNVTRRDNLGAGDFELPERAYSTDAAENLFRIAASGALNKYLFNELRFQMSWQNTAIDSLSDATANIVLNAFTSGGAQIENRRRWRDFEFANNIDFAFGKHTLRAGMMLEGSSIRSLERRNFNGTFTFTGLADYEAGRPETFTRRTGDPALAFTQYQLGLYLQDDFRLRKNLTLSYGLRHEWQSTGAEKNNFAPRFGFAWSPFKDGKTTIRGGAGIFYNWVGSEVYEQSLRVDGERQVETVIRHPGYPDPGTGGIAEALPPSRFQLDPQLKQPTIVQASLGVERQLPAGLMLRANYIWQRGTHLLRGRNINAPLADGTRPQPSFGNVTQAESSADSFNHLLNLNLNWARPGRFFFGAGYLLARATDETDGSFSLPADNFDLRGERGPALTDVRHRVFLFGNLTLWRGLRLGSTLQASTAPPYNVTTGRDNNGDTILNDRPAGISRNAARGAGRFDVGMRLGYGFGWGQTKERTGGGGPQIRVIRGGDGADLLGGMPGTAALNKRWRMEFYIQAYNLFNRANLTNFSGVQTSPFFGEATSAFPARRIETGVRFSF